MDLEALTGQPYSGARFVSGGSAIEGAALAAFFAAAHPQPVNQAILYGGFPRISPDPPDYPWGWDREWMLGTLDEVHEAWGEGVMLTTLGPSTSARRSRSGGAASSVPR